MASNRRKLYWWKASILLAVALTGCGWNKRIPPEPAPRQAGPADPILADTISSITYLADAEGRLVRGFGIVCGLGDNGSSGCPTGVREYLIESMTKESETWSSLEQRKRFSPGDLIDSSSTAVVEVLGIVPAGAPAGTRFDIEARAIPGTATKSLSGGLLLPCELLLPDPTGGDAALAGGTIVAHAGGPLFVTEATAPAVRGGPGAQPRGYVLGGGHSTDERSTRLLLREPSYPMARRLEQRINERFGQRPPVAEAMSRGYLELHTPREYAEQPENFLQLTTHLYLEDHPAFTTAKLRELTRLATLPNAQYEHLSLAWEGIGPTAIPQIQPLYSHENSRVRFAAARAGLKLGDVNALPVLAEVAASTDRVFALAAIGELGRCRYPQAAAQLAPLLDSQESEIRIATYQALLKHRYPGIDSQPMPAVLDEAQLNFVLDVIESVGEPLIYVRSTHVPRIAVFGARTSISLPVFYAADDDSVTLNATEDGGDITLFTKHSGHVSEALLVPPRVADLVAALGDVPTRDEADRLRGIGLPYSQVVQVLATLCADGTIPARLEIERIGIVDVLDERAPERPEVEERPRAEQAPEAVRDESE